MVPGRAIHSIAEQRHSFHAVAGYARQNSKIASWTATITTLMAAGLASGTAAQAATAQVVPVACSAAALAAALSSASEGATLTLAVRCTYRLTAGLPAIYDDLSIVGHGATLQRSTAPGTPKFAIIEVNGGGLTVSDLNFRNGVPAIDFAGTGGLTVNGGLFQREQGRGCHHRHQPGFRPSGEWRNLHPEHDSRQRRRHL
jgi:hypothetical protein